MGLHAVYLDFVQHRANKALHSAYTAHAGKDFVVDTENSQILNTLCLKEQNWDHRKQQSTAGPGQRVTASFNCCSCCSCRSVRPSAPFRLLVGGGCCFWGMKFPRGHRGLLRWNITRWGGQGGVGGRCCCCYSRVVVGGRASGGVARRWHGTRCGLDSDGCYVGRAGWCFICYGLSLLKRNNSLETSEKFKVKQWTLCCMVTFSNVVRLHDVSFRGLMMAELVVLAAVKGNMCSKH